MNSDAMTSRERRGASALASIIAFRMLGLFMILPVFALYAEELPDATPVLVGLAIGIYGLTQALLQIPFGMLSDRIGRKPVIAGGLLLFAAGSIAAGMADTIAGVVAGRALQGAGAIAAAAMALTADLTRDEQRTKAMAVIGMSIGVSFVIAMIAGPLLDSWIGVPGIFYFTAALALLGIVLLFTAVPRPALSRTHRDAEPAREQFGIVLRNAQLLRLDFGVFVLHLVMTAAFVVVPLLMRDAGLAPSSHWLVYLPVMVLAMAGAIPFIIVAERKRVLKRILTGAVAVLALAELLFAGFAGSGIWALGFMLWLFFAAFNLLEASMPSLVAKFAPAQAKGTAMGFFSSSQFFGAFVGGTLGGWTYGQWGAEGVFIGGAVLLAAWWLAVATMSEPPYLASRTLDIGPLDAVQARELELAILAVRGVAEASVNVEDGVVYLKVDSRDVDSEALHRFSAA